MSNRVFWGVVWSRGRRVEVMELFFAFCQPLTFISKPSFALHFLFLRCHSRLVSSLCLWPFLRDRSGLKLRSPSWLLNQSITHHICVFVCTHAFLFAHEWVQICAFLSVCVCVCRVRANLSATQCHRAIIPTLAQWPRLYPGFDPPPNLSLQALG